MDQVLYQKVAGIIQSDANWKLWMNIVNVEIGKEFYPTENIYFYPKIGLEAAFNQQKYHISYLAADVLSTDALVGQNDIYFKQNFWGVGPKISFDTLWSFVDQFGLYFDVGLAALWGQFTGHVKSYDSRVDKYPTKLIADQYYTPHTISTVVDIAIGLQFNLNQDRKNNHFSFLAGWEQQIWWDQAQHSASIPSNNLFLQGLTMKFIGSF